MRLAAMALMSTFYDATEVKRKKNGESGKRKAAESTMRVRSVLVPDVDSRCVYVHVVFLLISGSSATECYISSLVATILLLLLATLAHY